ERTGASSLPDRDLGTCRRQPDLVFLLSLDIPERREDDMEPDRGVASEGAVGLPWLGSGRAHDLVPSSLTRNWPERRRRLCRETRARLPHFASTTFVADGSVRRTRCT